MKRLPIVLGAVLLAMAGCGSGPQRGAATTTAAGGMAEEEQTRDAEAEPDDADPRRAEIRRLEQRIGLDRNALPAATGAPPGLDQQPASPEEDGERCARACQASGSICQASQRICSLADELDDDWSRGRCRLAARACGDARRRSTDHCGSC